MLIWINAYIVVMILDLIFEDDLSTSMHIDDKWKYFLIIGKDRTQGLDDTTVTVVAQYWITFSRSNRKFCLSLNWIIIGATVSYLLMLQKRFQCCSIPGA